MAREVNFVWNYCNNLSNRMIVERGRFLSGFDFSYYTAGASAEFNYIGSSTIQEVSENYAKSRRQQRKTKLRWRKSHGIRRSLGWVPFKARATKYHHGQIRFAGRWFGIWDSFGLTPETKLRAGCFSEDARGRWYFCVAVDFPEQNFDGTDLIGNEAFTTQTCSSCGALPDSRPNGIAGLGIRHWECCECGASHDRDVNAAINILHAGVGCGPLVEEIAA